MTKENIQVSFLGMEPSDALKEYAIEKIMKHEQLLTEATSIDVVLRENKYSRGVDKDFRIDVNVYLPKTPVRVEVEGPEMYANIDEATDTLARRLKRYGDKKSYWEGKESWKIAEADSMVDTMEEDLNDYSDYVPKIATRKVLEDLSPLEEGEAIEKMELLGYDQLLFRSKKTNKISMVYRRRQGGYGLVEPADNIL